MRRLLPLLTIPLLLTTQAAGEEPKDEYLWLEEIEGARALDWVRARNEASRAELEAVPEFDAIHRKNLEVFNSQERIPYPAIQADRLTNFWQDAEHVRGLWRRTTLEEYRKAETAWETVLDLDALAEKEKENWVWKGATCLPPRFERCLLSISRGGKDAVVVREFDTRTGAFVEDGFFVPEAKSNVDWKDENTLWVGTDFGKGSLTTSGYPRIAKEWKRGQPLEQARTVFEGETGDVSIAALSMHNPEGRYDFVSRTPSFFQQEWFLILGDRLVKLDIPLDAVLRGIWKEQLLLSLRSPWKVDGRTYARDALLAIDLDAFLRGRRAFEVLFQPTEAQSLDGVSSTKGHLLVSILDNVRGRLLRFSFEAGSWTRDEIRLPGLGTVTVVATTDYADLWFFDYTDFTSPSGLWLVERGQEPVRVKSLPAFFDASGVGVEQHRARSRDGTRVPYFLVLPKGFRAGRTTPTLLHGYGGFEISKRPVYSATVGHAWIERGGVYALANIRGGGEFGPRWHQAALKEKRHKAFEDFIAVAEDLIRRRITSPERLGILGGSNGGLLVGAAFTMRPRLFGAVVCTVPLLDMRRYHKLLAGASWMAEYGNPDDPKEWEWIRRWSPYHNLKKNRKYPRVFFFTSTRDDRVHPGHARKMVARMTALGKPVLYWENTEGGHAAAANNNQRATMWALAYAYLWSTLGAAR